MTDETTTAIADRVYDDILEMLQPSIAHHAEALDFELPEGDAYDELFDDIYDKITELMKGTE